VLLYTDVVRWTRAILTALAIAACAHPDAPVRRAANAPVAPEARPLYSPKWQVGDWWVVKTLRLSETGWSRWEWERTRCDVARLDNVGGHDCLVLEVRYQGPGGTAHDPPVLFYVMADSWLVIRHEYTCAALGTVRRIVEDSPSGLAGPEPSEPRLPHFPLRLSNVDTTFSLKDLDRGSAYLREVSSIADSVLVRCLLDDGDTAELFKSTMGDGAGRVMRPTSIVYQVRNESGGNLGSDELGGEGWNRYPSGERRVEQSLQFWSEDLPWRAYEQLVQYNGPKPGKPYVVERSWLVAVGHKGK